MALTNTILNSPSVTPNAGISNYGAQVVPSTHPGKVTFTAPNASAFTGRTQTKKYSVQLADLVALGAFTTGTVTLDTLPAGAIHLRSRIKHSVAVAGTDFSASTARLSFAGTALGAGALDVFAAIGTTIGTHEITSTTAVVGALESTNALIMSLTSTGGNLAATTAGTIDAWVEYTILN